VARVLLIGINYAPEMTGVGLNNVAMADLLSSAGHSVEVITGVPHYPEWRVRPEYRRRFRRSETMNGVLVERFRHYVPHRHTAYNRGLYELTFLLNAAIFRPSSRPDAVIGVVPSLGGGLLARLYAARAKAPWGIVFSDLMGRAAADAGMPGGRSVSGMVAAIELDVARAAAGVAVIADGFRPYLEAGGVAPSRIFRIINTGHLSPANPQSSTSTRAVMRKQLVWRQDEVIVLHSGSMGYKQALENLIAAAEIAKTDQRYRFVLMGDGNRRESLMNLTRRLGLRNVEFRGLAPAADYRAVLEAADVLIVNQRATVRDMSLPGKLSSYLAAGTPVVAAVASDSESAREIERSGGAIVIPPEDPQALMGAIKRIATEPTLRSELRSRSRAYEASTRASAAVLNVNGFVDLLLRTPSASDRTRN
jgi:colanic acid biosynthesis glycosyl transferase WcaI